MESCLKPTKLSKNITPTNTSKAARLEDRSIDLVDIISVDNEDTSEAKKCSVYQSWTNLSFIKPGQVLWTDVITKKSKCIQRTACQELSFRERCMCWQSQTRSLDLVKLGRLYAV